jgi:hypothetical protein
MAGSRIPGPIGTSGEPQDLNDGTLIRALSPRPGPIGMSPPPAEAFGRLGSPTSLPPRTMRQKAAAAIILVLRQGSRGSEVEKLQRLINLRLQPSPSLKVDGIFGPLTLQTVLQYQKGVSIAADGVVGKQTWYHLLKGDKATIPQPPIRPPQSSPLGLGTAAKIPVPAATPDLKAFFTQAAGVWEWPLEEKFAEALRRTAPKLPSNMHHEFEALLSPKSLGIVASGFVVWAGSHAFGVGEVVDIVLLIGGAVTLGMSVFDVVEDLGDFLVVTSNATGEKDLNEAASHLARAIAILGVAAFIALMAKVPRSRGGRYGSAEAPHRAIQEPQLSKPRSPPKPQPDAPEPKPHSKATVKFGKRGRYIEPGAEPPTKQLVQKMGAAKARANLPPPEKAGWPRIPSGDTATFTKAPEPIEMPEGTTLYRVIDSESNPNGSYWTTTDPRAMFEAQWRSSGAVKAEWNGDGAFVEYEVPKGGMKVWSGEAAPQMASDRVNMLSGGGNQIWVPPGSTKASTPISTGWIK